MRNERIVRDKFGKRLGSITDEGRDLVARDAVGNRLGSYQAATNSTRDAMGNRRGEGDTTASLILDEWKRR